MKKFLIALFAAALFALSLCACSSSTSSSDSEDEASLSDVEEAEDALIEHRVFLTDEADEYSEYLVVFYGNDTKKLVQINDETLFNTSAGYSLDDLSDAESIVESVYSGATDMDFCSIETSEKACFHRGCWKWGW